MHTAMYLSTPCQPDLRAQHLVGLEQSTNSPFSENGEEFDSCSVIGGCLDCLITQE